jgi:hypothetical protein
VADRKADLSWLGAEALPGDLAGINRVHDARRSGTSRLRAPARPSISRGVISSAWRWLKGIPRSGG